MPTNLSEKFPTSETSGNPSRTPHKALACPVSTRSTPRSFSAPWLIFAVLALAPVAAFHLASVACGEPLPSTPSYEPAPNAAPQLSATETQAMIRRVLQTELEATRDTSHPMQYRLRKTSPRLSTTKQIIETRDGDVARLLAVNNQPLDSTSQQTEDTRLKALLNDPSQQHHRQEREQNDAERARNIIRALPDAFLYSYAGIIDTPHGPNYRFTFQPNPEFDPHDIEAQVLKAMAGELWIDIAQHRVTHLQGKRLHDVDYGWGLVGKLDHGGTLLLEQADVGDQQWRTVHMVLAMNARVLFKVIKLDTTLELSNFTPVSAGIDYRQAIQLLQANPGPFSGSPTAFGKAGI